MSVLRVPVAFVVVSAAVVEGDEGDGCDDAAHVLFVQRMCVIELASQCSIASARRVVGHLDDVACGRSVFAD